ncbi:MAG TPA: efflux RND transporter periplasmic adaptor subunit [Labilithrix sp.]|nr:efflux RND transporter periplasmic adaptor subunit [Labilithrix sp.]
MSQSSEPHDPSLPPRADTDLGFDLPPPAKVSASRVGVFLLAAATLLVAAFLMTWLPKRRARQELEASTKADIAAIPRVETLAPKVLASDRALVLPGTMRPLEEATIRTRSNGYVRRRLVDIGDKVESGALLVEIDTPELDQQLDQARAQLAQAAAALQHAQASSEYSKASLVRREKLAPSGVTSQEELDKSRTEASVADSNVAVAKANLEAQNANVRRLTQEKAFSRVVAPFAGTITARSVEKGALVNPTAELFKLSTTDPMRVFIEVPQDVAPGVRTDVPASVTVREYAGRKFEGKVARSAGALDPQSRTMTTVVHVPNPKGELLAGMYARVEITLPLPHRVLEVPATSLLSDGHGTRVAVVGADKRIHLVPVVIERDTGPTIQIATGISDTDRVVRIASADLVEGREVELSGGQ